MGSKICTALLKKTRRISLSQQILVLEKRWIDRNSIDFSKTFSYIPFLVFAAEVAPLLVNNSISAKQIGMRLSEFPKFNSL